jgi:hypothetical protein
MNSYEKLTNRADLLAAILPENRKEKFRKIYLAQKGSLKLAEEQLNKAKITKAQIIQLHFIAELAEITYDNSGLIASIRKKKIAVSLTWHRVITISISKS